MINETKIKFCGLTNYDEVAFAYEKKIFWIGFIFVRGSPRFIEFGKTKNDKYKTVVNKIYYFSYLLNLNIQGKVD